MKRLSILFSFALITVLSVAQAKYVFMFIGDGMGPNQVLAAEMYLAELEGKIGRVPLQMTQFPYVGQVATFSLSNAITDSGAAGTCLASGEKTNNGMIGQSPEGRSIMSIATQLKEQEWGIGIATSVTIDHATPSSFYAHVPTRDKEYTIGKQLALSNFDFFGGGGFSSPYDKTDASAPNLYDVCEDNGYCLVGGYDEAIKKKDVEKMILLPAEHLVNRSQGAEALPYAIDRKEGGLNLAEIVNVAIKQLSQHDRFFLMAEGGKIDYSGHGNDGATNIHEVIDFDDAVKVAYQFYEQHPDETLIVVTADHETGGMMLGNSDYTLHLKLLAGQRCSKDSLSSGLAALCKEFGKGLTWEQAQRFLSDKTGLYTAVQVLDEEDQLLRRAFDQMKKNQGIERNLYNDINALAAGAVDILNRKSRLGWSTHGHSGVMVPVFAVGIGAERFTGWMDNSEIAPRIYEATRSN